MKHDLHNPACTGKCYCVIGGPLVGRCYRCGHPDVNGNAECEPPHIRRAAVSMIKRSDKYVVVWNTRYNGWTFPGGLVEDGERCVDARDREVGEEVGLKVISGRLVFVGRHGIKPASADRGGRAGIVYLYEVEAYGDPTQMEPNCPVSALTRAEFLHLSPYAPFYEHVFGALDERERIIKDLRWTAARYPGRNCSAAAFEEAAERFDRGNHLEERFP